MMEKIGGYYRSLVNEHPISTSILGRIGLCAGFETVGATFVSYLGGAVLGGAMSRLWGVFPAGALTYALFQVQRKTAWVALGALGAAGLNLLVQGHGQIFLEWGSETGLSFGSWLGSHLGTILGGYMGLMFMKSSTPFWDRSVPSDCYSVGMVKYLFAAELFERTIARATLPVLAFPLNGVRALVGVVFKTAAYSSSRAVDLFKRLIREKKFDRETLLPEFVQIFFSRYCTQNATSLTDQLISALSSSFSWFPFFERQMEFVFGLVPINEKIKDMIEGLGQKGDRLTTVLMRSFVGYVNLVRSSQRCSQAKGVDELALALKEEIPAPQWLLTPMDAKMNENVEEIADWFLSTLENTEIQLVGFSLAGDLDSFKPFLKVHIKSYILYVFANIDSSLLSAQEEEDFCLTLNQTLVLFYQKDFFSHKIVRRLERVTNSAISTFSLLRMLIRTFITHPEQRACLFSSIHINDRYPPGD